MRRAMAHLRHLREALALRVQVLVEGDEVAFWIAPAALAVEDGVAFLCAHFSATAASMFFLGHWSNVEHAVGS